MPNIDLSILNQKSTPAFFADTLANRPAPSFVGRIFISTDTYDLYRDTGSAWDLLSPSAAAGVTGTGVANQVAFWNGTTAITGENNLWWDSTNNHFGINTNTPGTALDIHHDQSTMLQLNQTTATNDSRIAFQNSGTALWRIGNFYNAGQNDWGIFDVVGGAQQFTIKKTTGQTFIGAETTTIGKFVVNNASSDNHIVVIGATAPSIRINNAGTGATRQIGIGLATTTNNFIQGSSGGELCIFNSTTTASPILFGIWNGTNNQEAGRFSAARNFLLGQTTDTGEKLQITGNAKITGTLSATTISKIGGSSTTLLATDGSTISAGTGISILGGTISATSSGGITGSGTSNYSARFTGTSSIGNGILQDDGFACAIGTTPSSLYQFTFAGNGNIRMTSNNYGLYFAGTGQFIDATLRGGLNNRFKFKDSGFTSGKSIITIQADSSGFSGSSLQCNNNNSDSVYKYAEFGFDGVNDVGYVDVTQNSSTNPTGLRLRTQGQNRVSIDNLFNVVIESFASQFNPVGTLYLPTISGAPSGTPTSFSNKAPMFIDSTNNRIYVYVNSSWKYSALI